MQNITAKTPTGPVTIQGIVLKVAKPFTEGHAVTANEASALNQLLAENVRNNCASIIKKAKDDSNGEPDVGALQTELDTYVQGYEFGARSGGGRSMDPVEKEARNIGKDKIREALSKQGIPLKEVTAAQITQLLDKHWVDHGDQWMKDAEAVVKARQKAASTTLADITLPPAAPATEEAAE